VTYALPALTTLIALLFYFVVTLNVARAHARYGVVVPAMTGHPDFERVYRVQMNTLEHFALFLPSLWLFAIFVSPAWASLFGAIWIVGRILYAIGYYQAAEKRNAGFLISFAGTAALWLGAGYGVVRVLLQG
jgi:glutathione S-transferase